MLDCCRRLPPPHDESGGNDRYKADPLLENIGRQVWRENDLAHLLSDRRLKYQPVGYLDQDETRLGSTIGGIPVWGDQTHALAIAT